ncbi:Gfo/Idh/MocA family protein [Campylobacter sp. CCUG 57310]|uniref:Gfo/Idh/MocA family protein n=1 Tax=Campylobacter sp. CCUG 57310 TaxID=2517362 RepID=UPI001567426D|nr:Gfo/Idh/MocA family oxidoreductase [Campylobacter sp. CCUG 57310]QKF91994.1 oxidoreductase, Gfo/Idh/MocA family [Campylobacter sp. CCUG 57310]
MTSKFRKIIRYIGIYGIERTLFKIFGRLRRFNIFLPTLKPKNIALIGCGQFGFATIGYFVSRKSPGAFLMAYDIDKNNQMSFEKFYKIKHTNNVDDIFSSPGVSIVYIASNHHSHTDYAIRAIKNNKIVYVEKPISVNQEQLKKLIKSIREYKPNIFAGYNRPFSSAIVDLKNSLETFILEPMTISCFISGHFIQKDHWYRKPEEGTRVCGNVGHWIDLAIHIFSWRLLPKKYNISIAYSNIDEFDDNIAISITTDLGDLLSIVLTARSEPFEGINETINFQYCKTIAKIDDFRSMTIWQNDMLIKKQYNPKDVGHKNAILQPFKKSKYHRDWKEVEVSTLLMLFVKDMVVNRQTNSLFNLDKEWSDIAQ